MTSAVLGSRRRLSCGRELLVLLLALVAACTSRDPTPARDPSPSARAPGSAATDPWAAQEQAALPPPVVTQPLERPFLWAATRDGKTSYLFGTVHGGVDAERRIPLWVWRLFEEAPSLVEEANLQDVTLAAWTLRPPGPTLREELGPAYWAQLEQTVTPFVAGLLDTQSTAAAAMRVSGHGGGAADAAYPMDGALLVRAQGLKKRIAFLETPAQQSAMLAGLHDVAALKRLLDRRAELAPLSSAFFAAYLHGDDAALADIARQQFRLGVADDAALERFVEDLLLARNRAWLATIEREHAQGGAFIAVGALHLVGPGSVLELLRDRGFGIQRMASFP